jgi:hypothetical protein
MVFLTSPRLCLLFLLLLLLLLGGGPVALAAASPLDVLGPPGHELEESEGRPRKQQQPVAGFREWRCLPQFGCAPDYLNQVLWVGRLSSGGGYSSPAGQSCSEICDEAVCGDAGLRARCDPTAPVNFDSNAANNFDRFITLFQRMAPPITLQGGNCWSGRSPVNMTLFTREEVSLVNGNLGRRIWTAVPGSVADCNARIGVFLACAQAGFPTYTLENFCPCVNGVAGNNSRPACPPQPPPPPPSAAKAGGEESPEQGEAGVALGIAAAVVFVLLLASAGVAVFLKRRRHGPSSSSEAELPGTSDLVEVALPQDEYAEFDDDQPPHSSMVVPPEDNEYGVMKE